MSTGPDFEAAIREAGERIGDIFREDAERQRREFREQIRAALETARGRVGGELAEALLQVLLVTDRWTAGAAASRSSWDLAMASAADEILTAIETGLGGEDMTEFVNDTGKWLLSFGIHRGTLTSRDSEHTEHDSEAEARQQYEDSRKAYASLGCQVWFAKMIPPGAPYSTGWIILDGGVPYA